jgi:2-methylisocitrate lyase-like PEP mutase family enzyme
MSDAGRRFRKVLAQPGITVLPGVFNGYSARLVQDTGYAAAAISGAGLSESLMGWADRGILGFEQNLNACRLLAECVDIPLLADADTGYGNALSVHLVVRAFEKAGLAAVSIEDQVWPKRCGHMQGKAVISAAEMASKVRAAVDARRSADFVIRARTDVAAIGSIQDVVDRLCLYAEAGADILFADALLSAEAIGQVARAVPKPLAVNMGFGLIERGTTPLLTPRQLEALGVSTVSYPRLLTSAALAGMRNALDAFAPTIGAERPLLRPDLQAPFSEINRLMGNDHLDALEARYAHDPG